MSEATMPLTEKQENVEEEEEPNFMAQWKTILLLIWLYLLQGVVIAFPLSLRAVMAYEVDMCEDKRHIDTLLSMATMPFSVKVVVAPIVDYLELPFFKGNKHRRGWILVCGIISSFWMFLLAFNWGAIDPGEECPNGELLLLHLLPIVMFAAIADIALDALAIIVLAGPNIGYAAVAGTIGQTAGTRGGKPVLVLMSETSFGMNGCLYLAAAVMLVTSFAVLRIAEPALKRPNLSPWSLVKKGYATFYDILCNRNALLFAFLLFIWKCGLQTASTSSIDIKYRGYTKKDTVVAGAFDVVPSLAFPAILAWKVTAKANPIKKLRQWAIPCYLLSWAIYFLTFIIVPYKKAKKDASYSESCYNTGCEGWVFPFRTALGIIAMPFKLSAPQLWFAHVSRTSPLLCAGTYSTILRTMSNLGGKASNFVVNPLRNALTDKTGLCNGSGDFFGKDIFAKNGTTFRYCGDITECQVDPPVAGQSGFCNPLADGFNRTWFLTAAIYVCVSFVLITKCLQQINLPAAKFSPQNEEERLSFMPRWGSTDDAAGEEGEGTEGEGANFYVQLSDSGVVPDRYSVDKKEIEI